MNIVSSVYDISSKSLNIFNKYDKYAPNKES